MATQTPVWTRAFLKSIGAQDNEIDYQNGTVTYKNKPFQYTTPGADGKAYGSQPELDSLYKSYQNNDAMEQLKASSAGRMGEVNTALGQYKQNISKAPTPFTYDANSIKSDPLYTSGLQSLQNDAQTATNQSLVNLGRRGIGNSQSAVTSANAQQQNMVNQANTKLMPQVIAQKYQAYLDANSQQDKQNQNLLGYANSLSGLGQQEFNNSRQLGQDSAQATQQQFANTLATNQDARAGQAQDFGQGITKAGLTGYYGDTSSVKKQMDANSAAWANASPEEQQRLHDENLKLGASIGSTYDPQTQEYSAPQGQRTMAGQAQDFTQGLQNRDQALQETQVNAQYAGMYNGQPTMQKIMQNATIANMTADNARQAAAEARSVGKEDLALKLDIWDRTGSAPTGIPGVTAGSSLAGKNKTPLSVQDAQNILLKTPFITEETTTDALGGVVKTGKTKIDKPGLVQAIAGLGMPDEQMDSLFLLNGISDKEVDEISKQLRASRGN